MSRITEVREGLKAVLSEYGEVQVWLGPNDIGTSFGEESWEGEDLKFSVKIIVGSADEVRIEERVDDIIEMVGSAIARKRDLGGVVSDAAVVWCSGHRLYGPGEEGKPPLMGCEFYVKVT